MPRPAKANLSIFAQAERIQKKLAKLDEQRAKVLADAPKEVMALIELVQSKK